MYGGENLNDEAVTVWSWIKQKDVRPKRTTADNLKFAVDWLGEYETDDKETAQELTNAIAFLLKEINKREKKTA